MVFTREVGRTKRRDVFWERERERERERSLLVTVRGVS